MCNQLCHDLQHVALSTSLYFSFISFIVVLVSGNCTLSFFHISIVYLSHHFICHASMNCDIKHLFNSFQRNAKYPLKIHQFTPGIHSALCYQLKRLICNMDMCLFMHLWLLSASFISSQCHYENDNYHCVCVSISPQLHISVQWLHPFSNFPVINFTP